jgi:hypothetical protein
LLTAVTVPLSHAKCCIYSNNSKQSDSNDLISITSDITTDRIEAGSISTSPEHQTASGLFLNNGNQINANTDISLVADSITKAQYRVLVYGCISLLQIYEKGLK